MLQAFLIILLVCLLIAAHKLGIRANQYNKVFGGVCCGIAQRVNMTPPLVRALTVLFGLLTGGFAVLLYLLLWATLPKE